MQTLLEESVIGLAGKETAIGDSIGLAIRTLDDAGVEQGRRVLILLTDGANTAGAVDPLKAAELAAQRNMVIYTIGIGADALTVRSLFGLRQINPSADLDETALTAIANMTGGKYFRARDTRGVRADLRDARRARAGGIRRARVPPSERAVLLAARRGSVLALGRPRLQAFGRVVTRRADKQRPAGWARHRRSQHG